MRVQDVCLLLGGNGCFVLFICVDVNCCGQVVNKDFVVIDFIGVGLFENCFDDYILYIVLDCNFDFEFG